jgi:hypothetical protein
VLEEEQKDSGETTLGIGDIYNMNLKRRAGRSLIVVGLISIILGIIFTLQSKSGWTVNGSIIIGTCRFLYVTSYYSGYLLNNRQCVDAQSKHPSNM